MGPHLEARRVENKTTNGVVEFPWVIQAEFARLLEAVGLLLPASRGVRLCEWSADEGGQAVIQLGIFRIPKKTFQSRGVLSVFGGALHASLNCRLPWSRQAAALKQLEEERQLLCRELMQELDHGALMKN